MKTDLLKLTPKQFCAITDACPEGAQFALKYRTMKSVWENCNRVDWLCWILNAVGAPCDDKKNRLFMVWCARNTPMANGQTTISLLTDQRSIEALNVAERYANGNATLAELDDAGAYARDAYSRNTECDAARASWAYAGFAARTAARAASLHAARAVALAAARDAACDYAWDYAGAAARAAVLAAEWDSAWDAQAIQFKTLVANPFL